VPGDWPFWQFPLGSPSACSAILLYGKQLHTMGSKEQINTKYCETKYCETNVFVKWPNSSHGRDAHATFHPEADKSEKLISERQSFNEQYMMQSPQVVHGIAYF
jgi:hypothetical protein